MGYTDTAPTELRTAVFSTTPENLIDLGNDGSFGLLAILGGCPLFAALEGFL